MNSIGAAPPSGPRRIASELLAALGLGALAGLLVSAYDGAALLERGAPAATLGALTGVMGAVGALYAALLRALVALAGVLARASRGRLRTEMIEAAFAAALLWPIWRETFSGAGVSRTWLGTAGPGILSFVTLVGVPPANWFVRLLARRARDSRALRSAGVLGYTLATTLWLSFDRHNYPHGYPQLHALLLLAAMSCTLCTLALMIHSTRVPTLALVTVLAMLSTGLAFPRDRFERELLALSSYAALRPLRGLQQLVDLDGDGRSPLFGGGDCDDGDNQVHMGAPEHASDGRDSNCDGRDDPSALVLPCEAFHLDAKRAQAIANAARGRPTVVLIVDALRGDRVGDSRFPTLAQLARESIQFTQAFSTSSSTSTSLPALFSGRARPRDGDPTLAELLSRAGRRAAYVSIDIVAQAVRGEVNVLESFDFEPFAGFDPMVLVKTEHDRINFGGNIKVPTDADVTERALALLRADAPPSLLVVHYFDLHQWNHLELDGLPPRMTYPRYDAVLQRVDTDLARWLPLRDRINLVLAADHGEALGANGAGYHTRFVFREMVHVPLLLRVPGVSATRIDTPVGLAALTATLLDLAGVDPPDTLPSSLLGLVGVENPGTGPGFESFETQQWALVYGRYRLVYTPSASVWHLYDLTADPTEREDVVVDHTELAQGMMQRLEDIAARAGIQH